MDTKGILTTLDFEPYVRDRLLEKLDTLDPGKRLTVNHILWSAYHAVQYIRELEIIFSKLIKDEIPSAASTDAVLSQSIGRIRQSLPPGMTMEPNQQMEEEFEKYPQYFSQYIVVAAGNELKKYTW